jgi:hypothetical protein
MMPVAVGQVIGLDVLYEGQFLQGLFLTGFL